MGKLAPGQREATYPFPWRRGVEDCGWGGIDLGPGGPGWEEGLLSVLVATGLGWLLWEVDTCSLGSGT